MSNKVLFVDLHVYDVHIVFFCHFQSKTGKV